MEIPKIEFNADDIRLQRIYDRTKEMNYTTQSIQSPKIDDVYGEWMFGELPEDRPLTYASYVMSVDGKIAFVDNEDGPLVAGNNFYDKNGGTADFWMLNLLRANCDGIIIGSGTLIKEPDYTGSTYDPDLIQARLDAGKHFVPWTVIVTRTGKNIPFEIDVFKTKDMPFLIATSPNGVENLKKEIKREYYILPKVTDEASKEEIKKLTQLPENKDKIAVLATGSGDETDADELMKVLRAIGMERVLVESPSYCHLMMEEDLLDEIYITTSCLFIGGPAVSIGSFTDAFTSLEHPHCEVVSIHTHSPHFFYTRYKMLYGRTEHDS